MRVLFARIGYMRYYRGSQVGDEKPTHGGSYNKKKIGHEVCNFLPEQGWVYGYVQPYVRTGVDTHLNLGRVDKGAKGQASISNVLVVFVARHDSRGQVIVGWYKNATLFRDYLKPRPGMLRKQYSFHIRAKASEAVLLPEKLQTHSIPKGSGAFGRANVVYPCESTGQPRDLNSAKFNWIKEAVQYVQSYDGANVLIDPLENLEDEIAELAENEQSALGGQGFQVDSQSRRKIENHAVARATKHFIKRFSKVTYVGNKQSYDLLCEGKKATLRVEVKGTQSMGSAVILTRNEVANARKTRTALYILHSIKWHGNGKSRKPWGGSQIVLEPWRLDKDGALEPMVFTYKIKQG